MFKKKLIYFILIIFGIAKQISKLLLFAIPIKSIKIIDRGEQDFFSRKDKKGIGYLGWFKDINFEGGYKLLDGLSDEHLEDLFMKIASENK